MMEKDNIFIAASSDDAYLIVIGGFIKEMRLQQNKTQEQVAINAGINRSTLSQIENGKGGHIITLIEILRVLNKLPVLRIFEVSQRPSPLVLARLEQQKRRRSRGRNVNGEDRIYTW